LIFIVVDNQSFIKFAKAFIRCYERVVVDSQSVMKLLTQKLNTLFFEN